MFRFLLLVHRYLGILIGWLVALWCLSGFVMMYVQYPELGEDEYRAGLTGLDLERCCHIEDESLGEHDEADRFSVEMLGDRPVLRLWSDFRGQDVYDLDSGRRIAGVDSPLAQQVASGFVANRGIQGSVLHLGMVERDQWTVSSGFDPFRPLHHFAANDEAGTQLYVSAVTPQVVQVTTAHERFWNWLGSVPHWLYPTALRQNASMWSQVVIWTSLVSIFLVLVGAYIGIRQLFGPRSGGKSPYKGLVLWHHYAGLVFGVLTLTWLVSGLFSMNPWGLMQGEGAANERARLSSVTISDVEISQFLNALSAVELPVGTVSVRSAPLGSEFAVLAYDSESRVTRLDGRSLRVNALSHEDMSGLAHVIRPDLEVLSAGWIDSGDAYYFSHHDKLRFPVWRIVFNDAERTRYYFDPDSAELISKVDVNRRWSRWLFLALHRGDFSQLMRSRPFWDLVLLPLLFGVTVGTVTGAWLGIRRLWRQKL